jgi:hypothetical protein
MNREKCVECGETLRKYKKGEPRIHRKCWLKIRDKDERCVDFLFCRDRRKEALKKMKVIEATPPSTEESVLLDIGGNEVYVPSHFFTGTDLEEQNKIIDQIIDVAGNIISPSSSPPLPPSPLSLIQNSAELDFQS